MSRRLAWWFGALPIAVSGAVATWWWNRGAGGSLAAASLLWVGQLAWGALGIVVLVRRGWRASRRPPGVIIDAAAMLASAAMAVVLLRSAGHCSSSVLVMNHSGATVDGFRVEMPNGPRELGPIAHGASARACASCPASDGWLSFAARFGARELRGCGGEYLDCGPLQVETNVVTLLPGGRFRVVDWEGTGLHDGPPVVDGDASERACDAWLRRRVDRTKGAP